MSFFGVGLGDPHRAMPHFACVRHPMELFDGGETHLRLLTAEFAFPKSGRLFTSHLGARRGTNNRAGSLGLGTSLPFRSTIVGDERIDLCPHRDSPHFGRCDLMSTCFEVPAVGVNDAGAYMAPLWSVPSVISKKMRQRWAPQVRLAVSCLSNWIFPHWKVSTLALPHARPKATHSTSSSPMRESWRCLSH